MDTDRMNKSDFISIAEQAHMFLTGVVSNPEERYRFSAFIAVGIHQFINCREAVFECTGKAHGDIYTLSIRRASQPHPKPDILSLSQDDTYAFGSIFLRMIGTKDMSIVTETLSMMAATIGTVSFVVYSANGDSYLITIE